MNLHSAFISSFDILTNDRLEASASGNAFTEMPLCIARLDKLSRNERVQDKLRQTEWDLIVVDEAHKMSATFFGGEIKCTKRYQLGRTAGQDRRATWCCSPPRRTMARRRISSSSCACSTRTASRARFRDGVHKVDVSDLMRHLVKEQLYKFDGTPLFPERLAYTINYQLSRPGRHALPAKSPITCARSSTAPMPWKTMGAREPSVSR